MARYFKDGNSFGVMKKCAQCGKEVNVLDEDAWVYKRNAKDGIHRFFCSWHCIREWDAEYEKKRKRRRNTIS